MGRPKSSSSNSNSNSTESKKSCNRGHWRPAEDERLRELVKQYGPHNWNFIAEHLQGRSGKSCRLRWYNQLDPNIIKKPFSDEEEEMLLALHKVKGNKWASIARFFPGRTDNAVKNHFHVLTARRKRERLTLFGDTNIGHNPISRINFNYFQKNYKNIGIFGMSNSSHKSTPWSVSSTMTSSFKDSRVYSSTGGEKSHDHNLDHSSSCCSSILGSYHSFTAPGLPSIGKIVPLIPRKFVTNSNDYNCHSNKGKNGGEKEQPEAVDLKQKGVSFIDFLGVGSSSSAYGGP